MKNLKKEVGSSSFLRTMPQGWTDWSIPSKEDRSLWLMIGCPKIMDIREMLEQYVYWIANTKL